MTEKSKRKGVPKRPIWQVLLLLVVLVIFGFAGWRIYGALSNSDDGADIVFIREEGMRVKNIYSLDLDDPEAEAVKLTDYTPNNSEQIDSIAYPDDASWVAYVELHGNDSLIKKIDLATGEISILFECETSVINGCWLLDVSPNGHYMVFGGLAKEIPGAEVAWLIDLEDDSMPPVLLEDGGTAPARFINNETIAYWAYEPYEVVTYDIASGEITPTGVNEYDPRFSPDGSRFAQIDFGFAGNAFDYEYTILNLNDNTESTFSSAYGHPKEPYISWHPDNHQFLVNSFLYEDSTEISQIVLMNATTGEGQVLVEQAAYSIKGIAWNPDGTQFLFWRLEANTWSNEGEIWVYDMATGEANPLNQVGSDVGWLN